MSMRFDDSDDVRLRIVPRKGGARGVSRERDPWISFYEDVQIFLSTPFQTLPDRTREQPDEQIEKFSSGCPRRLYTPEIRILYFVYSPYHIFVI